MNPTAHRHANLAQTCNLETALFAASLWMSLAYTTDIQDVKARRKAIAWAYLARACELEQASFNAPLLRERFHELTQKLPPSFWPQEARDIEKKLWENLKERK